MKRVRSLMFPTTMEEREHMLAWLSARFDDTITFNRELCFPIGVVRKEILTCVFCYHDHRHPDVQLVVGSIHPCWAHRETLAALLGWPFFYLKVGRITVLVEKGNRESLRIVNGRHDSRTSVGAGFKREGVIRKGSGNGKDLILFGLLREEFEAKYGPVPEFRAKAA